MIEININKISINFGYKNVLDNVSFEVKTGEIIGLIGENGCGKTTLLNIINKELLPDSGDIQIRSNCKIGYLKQIIENDNDITVYDLLYNNFKDIFNMEKKLRNYELKLSSCKEENLTNLLNKYGNLQEKYERLGGYEISSKINKIINGFKLEKLLDKNYNILSGGEKRIVSLANIMINNPDILILDEPTNHLDIDTLEWFEDYLKKYNKTVIIISHDRYFLDKVTTKTILIERGKSYIFNGNYSFYLKENEERIFKEFKDYNDQQKLISALKKKIKQLKEFGRLAYPGGEPFFRRAENIRKRLDRLEKLDKPVVKKDLPLNFVIDNRSGKEVVTVDNYNLKINENILINNINFKIMYGEKVCIMGKNGCGKSTLIKNILASNTEKIKIGSNVKIGYIPQEIAFDRNYTVLDYAKKYFDGEEHHLRSALNKFYFHHENIFKKVNTLSGGEKVRLKLFELIQTKCNLLILDEPTNHIDISTKELLEDALNEFDGTVLFVSHDRYFINNIATKILYIDNKNIVEYIGNYDNIKK